MMTGIKVLKANYKMFSEPCVCFFGYSPSFASEGSFPATRERNFCSSVSTMLVVYTANEILSIGLSLTRIDAFRQEKVDRETNLDHFRSLFGSNPVVYAQIWEDLQTTDIHDARIDGATAKTGIRYFLMSIYFLKNYPTGPLQESSFRVSVRTAHEKNWFFLKKIQALKEQKVTSQCHRVQSANHHLTHFRPVFACISFQIVWPELWTTENANNPNVPCFLLSVDGVHCHIKEPTHPVLSKNPEFYSHKTHKPALNYELGISVYEDKLVWMNGPFPVSQHDINIFRTEGLKDKIPVSKLVIGDCGYLGEPDIISTPNLHDPIEVRKLKNRARSRQETFNARIKNFACLSSCCQHKIHKHKILFEAVCVICQYQMDHGSTLFVN
jgi:hypothetical protein